MSNKTLDLETAEALIAGTATTPCKKCGESSWSKASLTKQTSKPGMLTLRCKVCASTASSASKKARYANDHVYREAEKAHKKARYANDLVYREAQKAKNSAHKKARYANDPVYREAANAKNSAHKKARYANDHVYREAENARTSAWQKENPGKCRAASAKRRAQESQATPRWVDPKEFDLIFINCPPGHHVDHIYPLTGPRGEDGRRIGCGFHAPINLQYLPASENIRKSNKWPEFILPPKLWKFYTWKLSY